MEQLQRVKNYILLITNEKMESRLDYIEKKKNKKMSIIGGGEKLWHYGHISSSDFSGKGSVFAESFFKEISNDSYSNLKDKILTLNYKLPSNQYIHAQIYKTQWGDSK